MFVSILKKREMYSSLNKININKKTFLKCLEYIISRAITFSRPQIKQIIPFKFVNKLSKFAQVIGKFAFFLIPPNSKRDRFI